MLQLDIITFGKYRGQTVKQVLKDRGYCRWLIEQEWFQTNYEYLYNRVKEYDPHSYFFKLNTRLSCNTKNVVGQKEQDTLRKGDFLSDYKYFNLIPTEDIDPQLELSICEKDCYDYYFRMISCFKSKILDRLESDHPEPYNIKAPTKWLQLFETKTGIPRDDFKNFLSSYDLQNIPYIIERIKKEGGVTYLGAQSFKIAKKRSESQEAWWEAILKEIYGEDLGTQFKYENCTFDAICISANILFEIKLGLKDFDEYQYKKYITALKEYRVIYLIGRDCVVDMSTQIIYTVDRDKYIDYINRIPLIRHPSRFDLALQKFEVKAVDNIPILFKNVIK